SFLSLLHCLMPSPRWSRRRRATSRPTARRLGLESLEDRLTPAAALLSVGDIVILEGNPGAHNAVVPVTLSQPHDQGVRVNYNTANGPAVAGGDYNAVSGKLTFAKNEMSKSILIPVLGDRVAEASETFFVRLSNAAGARITDGEGIVTIVDDEP